MKLGVAIPLIAAICLGSPAMASSNPEPQMVNGKGARDRNGGSGGSSRAEPRGGGDGGAVTRSGGERTATERRRDDGDGQRQAVQRAPDRDHDRSNPPVIVRQSRPAVVTVNNNYGYAPYYRPRYYAPAYYHRWLGSYYGWSPLSYAPWPLIYGSIGFANFGFYTAFGTTYPYAPYAYGPYPYPPYVPYAYSPWQVAGADIGGVRLKMQPRDAQVFVDGNYAGIVDDFDGTFQSLRLQQGGHKIEVHMPGFEDLELDVHVQPGKTITLQETMRPRP